MLGKCKKIGIIGATGMLGKPVVNALLHSGFEVYAMVRNIISAKIELPLGVQLLIGDLENPLDIENFLNHVDAVHLNLSIKPDEGQNEFHSEDQGLKLFLEIAKRKKIKRISYLSSLVMNYQGKNGFDWWVFKIKLSAIKLIRNAGIPYAIFFPSTFMENFLFNQKHRNKIHLLGDSEYKMFYISGEDYARQVANSYKILGDANREYPVQGLRSYTASEASEVFVNFYKKEKLKTQKLPLVWYQFLGKFNPRFIYSSKISEAMNHYPEKFQSESTWKELGKPILTLEEYAARL